MDIRKHGVYGLYFATIKGVSRAAPGTDRLETTTRAYKAFSETK